jgi:hypothetical protein
VAPVLQCPDCGTKHPLAAVPDAGTFPCTGCGRLLKVPEMVPRTARSSAPPAAPVAPPPAVEPVVEPRTTPEPEPETRVATPVPAPVAAPEPAPATRVVPPVEPAPATARSTPLPPRAIARSGTTLAPVPVWARFGLWLIAVPLGFFIVFAFARGLGWFTSDQQSDVFLARNVGRFWPVVRLLPFVALVTAGIVHGGVYALARWRGRRAARRATR